MDRRRYLFGAATSPSPRRENIHVMYIGGYSRFSAGQGRDLALYPDENWRMLLISDAAADSTRLAAAPFRGRLIAHVSHYCGIAGNYVVARGRSIAASIVNRVPQERALGSRLRRRKKTSRRALAA